MSWKCGGTHTDLELFATVELSQVSPVLRGLTAHQSEGWGEDWLTSVVESETGVLLREITSKREMRVVAPSLAPIDALGDRAPGMAGWSQRAG